MEPDQSSAESPSPWGPQGPAIRVPVENTARLCLLEACDPGARIPLLGAAWTLRSAFPDHVHSHDQASKTARWAPKTPGREHSQGRDLALPSRAGSPFQREMSAGGARDPPTLVCDFGEYSGGPRVSLGKGSHHGPPRPYACGGSRVWGWGCPRPSDACRGCTHSGGFSPARLTSTTLPGLGLGQKDLEVSPAQSLASLWEVRGPRPHSHLG